MVEACQLASMMDSISILDEIEIANETAPISILGDSVFTGLSHADKFGLCEYQISNEGSFHKKDTHLIGLEVLELENNNPYLLGRTREGFLLSSPISKGSFRIYKIPHLRKLLSFPRRVHS